MKIFVQVAGHEVTFGMGSWGQLVFVSLDAWLRIFHQATVSVYHQMRTKSEITQIFHLKSVIENKYKESKATFIRQSRKIKKGNNPIFV